MKKGSPARIFTNVPLKDIELAKSQGYKYCETCEKFTFEENVHCIKCNLCPSKVKTIFYFLSIIYQQFYCVCPNDFFLKDGGYYKHCNDCIRCVKASYEHCNKCNQCHLKDTCQKRKGEDNLECLKKRKT